MNESSRPEPTIDDSIRGRARKVIVSRRGPEPTPLGRVTLRFASRRGALPIAANGAVLPSWLARRMLP